MIDTERDDTPWREMAACRSHDPGLFFPVGETGQAASHIRTAKTACSQCEVVTECLHYAVTTGQRFGVWGGTDERERRSLRRRWVNARNAVPEVNLIDWLSAAG